MLPLFSAQNGQSIKIREFAELIGCGKARFQAPIFSPEKKTVSLLSKEQLSKKKLKIKNVNNVRFPSLMAPIIHW